MISAIERRRDKVKYGPQVKTQSKKDQKVVVGAFTELSPRYEKVVNNELNRFWGWSYAGFVDRLIESTPIADRDTILDLATGTSAIPRRLVEKVKKEFQVVGLDITARMLIRGKAKIDQDNPNLNIHLACGDAMVMPFSHESFNVVICGLATHHMNTPRLLSEMRRVLKPGGALTISDVGGSLRWQQPGIRTLILIATFIYFLVTENILRARTETSALPNVYTAEEWQLLLRESGFTSIQVTELPKSHTWIPSPLLITAK